MADSNPSPTPATAAPELQPPAANAEVTPPSAILLRSPSIYPKPDHQHASNEGRSSWAPPPLPWLERTWSVTHSTLPMWRKAKNVTITYKLLPPSTEGGGVVLIDDEVCSEPTQKTWLPQPKSIRGVDTPVPGVEAAWNWRGRGLLKIASSHWEVLGWGESDVRGVKERWVVTWFKASLFTPMGVDVYSDRREGVSEALFRSIERALEEGGAGEEVGALCKGDMQAVKIEY